MTVADVSRPYVVLGLDTRPPRLALEAEARVEPPDHLVVVVRADEPVGVFRARFTDAGGTSWLLGHERLDGATLRVEMPTVGVATGPGVLRVEASDRSCNPATVEWPVLIDRPRPYDLSVSTRHERVLSVLRDHAREFVVGRRSARRMEVDLDGE